VTKIKAEKLDALFFLVQNTAGNWTPEEVMEMYYYIEQEIEPFDEPTATVLDLIESKEQH